MQIIYAGNIKKSAFIRSQLEACKIGQRVKKAVFYLYFRSAVKSIPFEPVLNGWVQKMRAEGGKRGKGKRREKKRKKEVKMGIKIVLFFSSPEPKAHRWAYSIPMVRRPSYVVRRLSTMLKHLLLRNCLADQSKILCGASLGRGNKILFAASRSHDQDGRHAYIW